MGKNVSTLFVDVYRDGEIVLGTHAHHAPGALRVASCGPTDEERLADIVTLYARHSYQGELLCPGVPEAETDHDAVRAVERFVTLIEMRMRGDQGWPPNDAKTPNVQQEGRNG